MKNSYVFYKEKEMKEENFVSFVTWEKKVLLWNRSVPTGNKFLFKKNKLGFIGLIISLLVAYG